MHLSLNGSKKKCAEKQPGDTCLSSLFPTPSLGHDICHADVSRIVEGKTHAEVATGIKVFVGPLVPENENDGSDNLDGESHEVGPTDDLQYREGDADEDEETGVDLITGRVHNCVCHKWLKISVHK